MAKTNQKSLRLDSDYTEDIVGFAIESFLSLISFPFYRFSIEPFSRRDEPNYGADARLLGRIKGFNHSPLSLPEGAVSLASFLKSVSEGFLSNDSVILVSDAQRALQRLLTAEIGEESLPMPNQIFENQDGIGAWLDWGDFLRQEFGIEQYALIRWEE